MLFISSDLNVHGMVRSTFEDRKPRYKNKYYCLPFYQSEDAFTNRHAIDVRD